LKLSRLLFRRLSSSHGAHHVPDSHLILVWLHCG
jgi:hypothetical protein